MHVFPFLTSHYDHYLSHPPTALSARKYLKASKLHVTSLILNSPARRRTEDASKLWALGESGTAGPKRSGDGRNRTPGYVALAVRGPGGTSASLDVDTGSADRAQNMLEFAVHALELLLRSVRELDDRERGADGGTGRL